MAPLQRGNVVKCTKYRPHVTGSKPEVPCAKRQDKVQRLVAPIMLCCYMLQQSSGHRRARRLSAGNGKVLKGSTLHHAKCRGHKCYWLVHQWRYVCRTLQSLHHMEIMLDECMMYMNESMKALIYWQCHV